MLKKLMTLAALAAVGVAVKLALPDLKRYLEMRKHVIRSRTPASPG